MAIISLDKTELSRSITQTSQKRFYFALQQAGFEPLLSSKAHLPSALEARLRWAKVERWLSPALIHIGYVVFAFLFVLVQNLIIHWTLGILLALPVVVLIGFIFYIQTDTWAQNNIKKLLDTPFLFIYDENIYENFPNLRKLDDEIEALKHTQIQTQASITELAQLAKDMKEQLILLGQDTNDQHLQGLESQSLNQVRLLSESQTLLEIALTSRQDQIKLQQELLDWAELDRMRQRASEIAGTEAKKESWQKMTTLEMRAAELAFQMHELNQKLHHSLAKRSAENEVQHR